MALRREDLIEAHGRDAVVLTFPTARVRGKVRAQRRMLVRRRRSALVAGFLGIVVAVQFATGPSGTAPASVGRAPKVVTLQPGESLWDVADRYASPSVDPRAYVDALVEANGLAGAPQAGQRLRLP